MMPNEELYGPLLNVIEFLGTFAFAISGIRHAAAKRFDWFGGFMAQLFVIVFARSLKRLDNTWFFFDTLGLALFTVAGLQKTLDCGHAFWVAIIMGTITGSAGGVIRDVLLNNVPVIFQKEIYAMASVIGGLAYWGLVECGCDMTISVIIAFFLIVAIRILAVKYHISLPVLKGEE